MSVRLLHLSDPHFGTERGEVVAAVREAAARLAPDMIVLSGISPSAPATPSSLPLQAFMASLGDVAVAGGAGQSRHPAVQPAAAPARPVRGFRAHFGALRCPPASRRVGDVELLSLVSCPPSRHKNGELDLAALAAALPGGGRRSASRCCTTRSIAGWRRTSTILLRGADEAVRMFCAWGWIWCSAAISTIPMFPPRRRAIPPQAHQRCWRWRAPAFRIGRVAASQFLQPDLPRGQTERHHAGGAPRL